MNRGITQWKDIDRKILKTLDEKSILAVCSSTSKLFNEICNDQFIQELLEERYPGITKYKEEEISWKQYLLVVSYWIGKLKEEYDYQFKGGNPKDQYNIFRKRGRGGYYGILFDAAKYGEIELVKYAVEKGANIHYHREYPLFLAVREGNLDVVKYLVERGADVFSRSDLMSNAVRSGNVDLVKYLVSLGIDFSARELFGELQYFDEDYTQEEWEEKYGEISDYLLSLEP